MVALRGKCSTLFIYLFCGLTVILGTNQKVMCHENKVAHLQLIECSPLQSSHISSDDLSTSKASSGSDNKCPDCLDVHITFLKTNDNNSSLHAVFDAGLALFSVNQFCSELFNPVAVQQEHLALTLPLETTILACLRTTILLI
jgi:hypothetical protein